MKDSKEITSWSYILIFVIPIWVQSDHASDTSKSSVYIYALHGTNKYGVLIIVVPILWEISEAQHREHLCNLNKRLSDICCVERQLFLREVTSAERGAQLSTSTSALVMAVTVNCNIVKAELLIACSARPADLSWHTLSRQGRRYHAYHNVRHFNCP